MTNDESGFRPDWTGKLLGWYRVNRRVLPWRERPEPYRVWASEIMLQQTRIEVVIPYFERFMKRLPTIADLAAVDEDVLFKLWEGLGYYRRAANMKKAAVAVVAHHEGILPDDRDALRALPGIGPYTAGAILSIAFGIPEPAIDGNVKRVTSRLFGVAGPVDDKTTAALIEAIVRRHTPPDAAGDYTQALMELGALVCLPNGAPRCSECPGRDACVARRDGRIEELPETAVKKKRRIEERTVFAIRSGAGVMLVKRPDGGLLAGLWGLPSTPGKLDLAAAARWAEAAGLQVRLIVVLAPRRHVFTHVEWDMIGYCIFVEGVPKILDGTVFEDAAIRRDQSVPTAFRGFLEESLKMEKRSNEVI